jgi:hypothetical protein
MGVETVDYAFKSTGSDLGSCSSGLESPDNWQQIGRELIGRGDLYGSADYARVHDVSRIAKPRALRLLGGQRGLGALGDEPAFLLRRAA